MILKFILILVLRPNENLHYAFTVAAFRLPAPGCMIEHDKFDFILALIEIFIQKVKIHDLHQFVAVFVLLILSFFDRIQLKIQFWDSVL